MTRSIWNAAQSAHEEARADEVITGDLADVVFQGNCCWSLTGEPVAIGDPSFAARLAAGPEKAGRSVAGRFPSPRLARSGAPPAWRRTSTHL
jgi:hypothetical protein